VGAPISRGESPLRRSLLRELLRLPVLPRLPELPLSLLLVMRRRQQDVPGRSRDWIKSKNPAAPAMKREAEEDWGRPKWP